MEVKAQKNPVKRDISYKKPEKLEITEPNNLLNIFDDVNAFRTVSAEPSGEPKHWSQKVQVYINGSTYRIYCWDATNNTWRYAALT